ncbi:MAG: DUF1570 domain-containing protein [Planctomycetaceae bacterium]
MPFARAALVTGVRTFLAVFAAVSVLASITVGRADDVASTPLVTVTLATEMQPPETVSGRILVKAQDGGLLLEDRSGRLHQLTPKQFSDVAEQKLPFTYLSSDELAGVLLQQTGGGFVIHVTEHFVLCSDASELYTQYCGRLLEKVFAEFRALFGNIGLKLQPVASRLPVLVFREPAVFQTFAQAQHPDTDFTSVPGYYSVRDNQMLITAVSGDRDFGTNSDVLRELRKRPRRVETIVHEAVHQLAFNTGLQVRYADNPMWLSEGLAVYFETASGRGALVWSRPGERSRIHLPGFREAVQNDRLRLSLSDLLTSDNAFAASESLADAYAEGWALTYFLITEKPEAFHQLMLKQQARKPLVTMPPTDRLNEVEQVTGTPAEELEQDLIRYMSRLRNSR